MEFFEYSNNELMCEGVRVKDIVSEVGSPAYIYSKKAFIDGYNEIKTAFQEADPLICFSVKSNSNLSVLSALANAGSGFDVVSGGELFRALKVGANPEKIVYAGVGKSSGEIKYALENNILMFNVESWAELQSINKIASQLDKKAQVAIRINPDVDAKTHSKTTTGKKENKFGIDMATAERIISESSKYANVAITGIHVHLGSPIHDTKPYEKGLEKVNQFLPKCKANGVDIKYLNIGGGYCISYTGKNEIRPKDYAAKTMGLIKKTGCKLIMEPGRFISGNAGIMVTKVIYKKQNDIGKKFVICDAGMNDLLRPALYDANHRIWPVSTHVQMPKVEGGGEKGCCGAKMLKKLIVEVALQEKKPIDFYNDLEVVDVVGPVCESSDVFAKDRPLPRVDENELLAIFSAGAYGFTMSSPYNSRPRPCEVLVDGSRFDVVRKRETYDDLIALENI